MSNGESKSSWRSHLLRLVHCALVIGHLGVGSGSQLLAASSATDAPENQKESDWIDARWSRTAFGNFQASLLALPEGTIAKGLSVRVGERGEAALAYDTASLALRAGWTDGFLEFSSDRYGLIRAPRP